MAWQKQQLSEPIFSNLVWSRPESKAMAGKITIIGGNKYDISVPAQSYTYVNQQGIGSCHVLMPLAAKKLLPGVHADISFAPTNPSGSFSQKALPDMQNYAASADCTLVAGGLGRNSETAVVLENLVKQHGHFVISKDSVDYFVHQPLLLLDRENTVVVASFAQIQKIMQNVGTIKPITFDMGAVAIADSLQAFTVAHQALIVVEHNGIVFCALQGEVISTNLPTPPKAWRVQTAAAIAVWWAQNPSQTLEAAATAITQIEWSK